ncbi:response regulator [Dyadobacter sp. NIV53]|uniref:response regulator n=1 Tax=Dyadobacter sp. NIV53 TaxID=2861765 RepID=UPI001C87CA03|nr:response regulator [Dyadobacter sp. NIV53]
MIDTEIEKIKKHNFRNGKILLVEDNPDQTEIIKLAIKECIPEVELIIANDPVQALMLLDEMLALKVALPKLILLDLYLPEKEDGWQVLKWIKEHTSSIKMLPVIILSGSEDQEDIREAYSNGGSAYTVKPLNYASWLDYFNNIRKHWMETVILPY